MVVAEKVEIKRLQFADEESSDDTRGLFIPREGLSWYARKQVEMLETISRGFMLVTGEPGGGKDLFTVSTSKLFKYIFNRPIILDFKPNKAFGEYTLFGVHEIIRKIREIAKAWRVLGIEDSKDKAELSEFMEEATVKWLLEGEGYDIFKGAVWDISELKKVAHNRKSMTRPNIFIGTLGTVWRHLDLLLMGTHVYENELDPKAFLQYAKLRTYCSQTLTQHVFQVIIRRGIYQGPDFVVSNVIMKPLVFTINGNEPRDFLSGKRFYDLYSTKHMNF